MSKYLLDLPNNQGEDANREALNEYREILENPDLLGRLFRLFHFKNCHKGLWKEMHEKYLERNSHQSAQWHIDKRTNTPRNLFKAETVTWIKFLEGLSILSPAFDDMTLSVFTTLNDGRGSSIKILKNTAELNDVSLPPIPKGDKLIPDSFERNPLEPLPLKVVRDAIAPIQTASEFRNIVRDNLKPITHSSKLSSAVNSLYVSVLKSDMTWRRMTSILFALGATQMVVSIRAIKDGKVYTAVVEVRK